MVVVVLVGVVGEFVGKLEWLGRRSKQAGRAEVGRRWREHRNLEIAQGGVGCGVGGEAAVLLSVKTSLLLERCTLL